MISGGTEILKQVVFNRKTDSEALHNFMTVNFHHRQGIRVHIRYYDDIDVYLH